MDDHSEIANNGSSENDVHILETHVPISESRSPVTVKGYGLRKWKRIPRDVSEEPSSSAIDNSKMLKRLLPGEPNLGKAQPSAFDMKLSSEGSVGSVNFLKNMGAFADSENSEDRSSKSSTATSFPNFRYEKTKPKGVSAKNLGGKGKVETSKKARGERVQFEKENSQSSIESDSRSSNLLFMQSANAESNGKQATSYDGENSEEGQTAYSKHNVGEVEDSQDDWGVKEAKNTNKHFPADRDPLVDSLLGLQSLQEALAKEVCKLGEIGTEPILSLEKLMADCSGAASSSQLGSAEITETSLQAKVSSLEESVNLLECQLAEKESKIAQLGESLELELGHSEVESLFKQRIEAEIEYLTITRATQGIKVIAQVAEQERVAEEVIEKLGDAEVKAENLKKEAENFCSEVFETEEVLVTQRRVCKLTWCLCTQLVLFVLVLWIFVSELSHRPGSVVPT